MTTTVLDKFTQAARQRWVHAQNNRKWQALSRAVERFAAADSSQKPVILFNASTRLQAMSQNAAFSYLTGLMLKLQNVPVIHFACRAGMNRCVLGSNRDDFSRVPPCAKCIAQSRAVFPEASTVWVDPYEDAELRNAVDQLTADQLECFTWQGKPLGFWAVNSLRWMLRRHHLQNDHLTLSFFRSFILSGWNFYRSFAKLADEVHPQAVVLFNGMFYPEAAVRYACLERDIRVITHEVGMRPFTCFFTPGEATAYPIQIDPTFQLTAEMDQRLDEYLGKRFSGDFTMAGIRFWPEMRGLNTEILAKISCFKQVVPIFTNVIFDTSQVHANTLFADMFDWLDHVRAVILKHPETLFILRAHPDEHRTGKESRESVADWVRRTGTDQLPNVLFVDSREFLSSYDLIHRSHFVMVYNSTIGLESVLLGKVVLAGGKARFTQLPTAFLPASVKEYEQKLEELLNSPAMEAPLEFQINARRFLYFQLYVTSLPFEQYLKEDGVWKGYVSPREFELKELLPENSATVKVILDGILRGGSFFLQP